MRSAADYSTLSTEEISNLPIAYFCRDTRHGQPTTEFIERENDVIRKLNAPPETQASSEETPAQAGVVKAPPVPSKVDSQPQTVNRMAAQVRIVDGQVVIDTDSLVVNRSDMAGGTGEPLDVVDESARTQFTNSLTYVVQRTSRKRWKPEETEMFYQKLRIYGTDFQMLAAELPGRNRYDVRNKFKVEERKNGLRITETLLRRDPQPPKSPQRPIPTGLPESLETYSIVATPEPQPQPEPGLESESGLKADSVDHLNGSDSDDMPEARDLFGLPSVGASKAGSSQK
ncbi:hypothetical protein BX661DRAFT_174956 [Kickxella alabastrina]|uniref:uncharacterized protein n=1 Tax=Kickxella alabastrina TaxID=61397 RepID=UPI002220A022|nr:uncharacterized protein BX661DRAFT_174956 [Kickxella alabastrina]KAI7834499.1 hypothetical protein BX661DRAFT_174956 [Kickxella alabastrina]